MADFFSQLENIEEDILGPEYPYYDNIKTPNDLNIVPDGGWDNLANDVGGLISYVEVLVDGKSKASNTGQPLGNKFFIRTPSKCMSNDSSNSMVDRYIYVNNIPQGNLPFISQGMDADITDLRGLIPGLMENINVLNPVSIFKSFTLGPTPPCRPLEMQVIDASNNITYETHHVLDEDIREMDPCLFIYNNNRFPNPVTGKTCREAFQNINPGKYYSTQNFDAMPSDILVQLYYISLALLALYLLLKLCQKSRR